jgi:hypothetical protein
MIELLRLILYIVASFPALYDAGEALYAGKQASTAP